MPTTHTQQHPSLIAEDLFLKLFNLYEVTNSSTPVGIKTWSPHYMLSAINHRSLPSMRKDFNYHSHAVSANRILWVYAGFWWYHGILVVHLQDSVGAFWAIKYQDASIRGLSVENVMTDGLSRVCIWWCIMLSLITKITGIYFVGEKC